MVTKSKPALIPFTLFLHNKLHTGFNAFQTRLMVTCFAYPLLKPCANLFGPKSGLCFFFALCKFVSRLFVLFSHCSVSFAGMQVTRLFAFVNLYFRSKWGLEVNLVIFQCQQKESLSVCSVLLTSLISCCLFGLTRK